MNFFVTQTSILTKNTLLSKLYIISEDIAKIDQCSTSFVRAFIVQVSKSSKAFGIFDSVYELCPHFDLTTYSNYIIPKLNPNQKSACSNTQIHLEANEGSRTLTDAPSRFHNHLFYNCDTKAVLLEKIYRSRSVFQIENLSARYVHVWISVLGNYSMKISETQSCVNGKWVHTNIKRGKSLRIMHLKLNIVPETLLNFASNFPLLVHDRLYPLRFVSCGYRDYTGLPFNEFVNVFEPSVWWFVILTVAVMLFTPHILHSTSLLGTLSLIKNLDCIFRILIGLDNPLSERALNKQSVRMFLTGILLAAIILNNAYKNDNIVKMISPRMILPYRSFDDLLADNYKIHAKINSLIATTLSLLAKELHFITNHYIKLNRPNFMVIIESHVYSMRRSFYRQGQSMPLLEQKVFNNSRVHPDITGYSRYMASRSIPTN